MKHLLVITATAMLIGCATTPPADHPKWGQRLGGCYIAPQQHDDGSWWLDLDRDRPSNLDGNASGQFWADAQVFVTGAREDERQIVRLIFAPDISTLEIPARFKITGAAKSACDAYATPAPVNALDQPAQTNPGDLTH